MDLFYGRMSGNSARSVFALYESGAQFTPRLLDTRSGENRIADYLAVNPMGKIPALVDGSFRLWESNAINWYVAEKHPAAGLLPATTEGRAAVLRWLFIQAAHVTPACGPRPTVLVADELLVEVDDHAEIAGLWLIGVPSFPADADVL